MSREVAGEIFSIGICNMKCSYCYIPKSKEMAFLHKQIIEDLQKGKFIERLKKNYGENLEILSFWGTEPTLILNEIIPYIPTLKKTFPKLNQLGFSTNLLTGVDKVLEFINVCQKENIKTDIQISLDGQKEITDVNRMTGATEKVVRNSKFLMKEIGTKNIEVKLSFKPTLTMSNLKYLCNIDHSIEWFTFFEDLITFARKNLKGKAILESSPLFSLCVPGKYTTEDGKLLAKFFEVLDQVESMNLFKYYKGSLNMYYYRLKRLMKFGHEFFTKPSMFTCSGGDSQMGTGIKDDLHICHRSFFLNHQNYLDSILQQKKIENWDVSLFSKGLINNMTKNYITSIDDSARFKYVMRNYHDFTKFRLGYCRAMLYELVFAKQVSSIYLDDEIALLFSLYLNTAFSCPAENILNTGNVHLIPVSIFRLMGNGAFEAILLDYCKREKKLLE